jgi:hypothetical protein
MPLSLGILLACAGVQVCRYVQMTTVLANDEVPACLVLERDREGKRATGNDSNNTG